MKGLILTPRGYRLWEKIFKHNITELNIDLFWLMTNTIAQEHDTAYNLLASQFYSKQLLPYFLALASNTSNLEPDQEMINKVCTLVSNLLQIDYKEEANIHKILINSQLVLINFSSTSNMLIYELIMFGLSKAQHLSNKEIQEAVAAKDLVSTIVLKRKFFENRIVALYSTRFMALYQSECDLSYEINLQLIDLFTEGLDHDNEVRKRDSLWSLSNLIVMPKMVRPILEKGLLQKIIQIFNEEDSDTRGEALYCIANLITNSDFNDFLNIMKEKVFELLVESLRYSTHDNSIIMALESIYYCLRCGEVLITNFNYNPVKVKFTDLGGLDLITSIQSNRKGQNVQISSVIDEIIKNFSFDEQNEKLFE